MQNIPIYPPCLRKIAFIHVDFSRIWRNEFFITDQYNKGHYINSTVDKIFFYDHHFFVYYYCLLYFAGFTILVLTVTITNLITSFHKQLLTDNIFHWFVDFVLIFRSIRLFLAVNIINLIVYLSYEIPSITDILAWSEISSRFGPALCCNQPVYLHCELVGWFLHGAGFLLGEILEQNLVLFLLFLILLALLFNTFRSLQVKSLLGLYH